MKKVFYLLSVLAILGILVMTGCTQSPSPSASPSGSTTPVAAGAPIELSFSLEQPPMSWGVKEEWEPWARNVEAATGGRVKITLYPGSTLNPAPEMYDAAVKGIADMSWGPHIVMPGRFPLLEVFTLPGVAQSMQASQQILWELNQKYPLIQEQHPGVKVIWLGALPEMVLVMKNKPVRTLEDVASMKIRATGEAIETWKAWSASPIVISSVEAYQSLDKGVIDGAAFDLNVLEAFKLHEITNYMTLAPCTGGSLFLVMNMKRWEALPADIQQIFIDAGNKHWLEFSKAQDDFKIGVMERYASLPGREIIQLSDTERAKWLEKAQPLYDKWAADIEAKGLPGKAFLADTLELAKKYNAMYPLAIPAK